MVEAGSALGWVTTGVGSVSRALGRNPTRRTVQNDLRYGGNRIP